jgi:uncharacterized membrane protein YhaH (DUF805 family)
MDSTSSDAERPPISYFWNCRCPISRRAYATIGVVLMLVKYGVEASSIWQLTGRVYTPLDFLNPLMNSRRMFLHGAPEWFGTAWLIWTLPFVTIAVVLSVRRAIDAGWSPWLGLVILVPFTNLLLMLTLACVPSANVRQRSVFPHSPPPAPADEFQDREQAKHDIVATPAAAARNGVFTAAAYMLVCILLTIYAFDSYGVALFFGTPIVGGAFAAYTFNLSQQHGLGKTLVVSTLPVLCVGAVLLGAAFEGVICLFMAAPIFCHWRWLAD